MRQRNNVLIPAVDSAVSTGTISGRSGKALWLGLLLLLISGLHGVQAIPSHGVSISGELKYPAGFTHFDYLNPRAPKGGTLVLGWVGSFDTLNGFALKGRPPLFISYLFDTLTEQSLDEPFSEYGLLAEKISVASDKRSVTYQLKPGATFSDGKPVTAQDVVFTLDLLRSDAASPLYKFYYHDIAKAEALDAHTVKFHFARLNPELAMIIGQLAVLPRHVYGGKDFSRDFNKTMLGSGPYLVESFDFGKQITYRRNPAYWGAKVNVNAGQYNFERIVVKYYKDDTVQFEAFKAGEFDFAWVNSSKRWAREVQGTQWDKGYVQKEILTHKNTAGMQGFVFNLRRPLFTERLVRKALALVFDFEWSNKNLFFGQYTATDSYFDNSELAAEGLPGPEELALLEPFRGKLPAEVFSEPMGSGVLGGNLKTMRERLRAAKKLLNEAGWQVRDGVLTHRQSGIPMRFTVTLISPSFQRIVEPYVNNLRRLGVEATIKVVDSAVYERLIRQFAFDMVVSSWGQSQSPGNEQQEMWHSVSANREGSRNLAGIQNPVVDALVDGVITAKTRKSLIVATHALDRVLWHNYYVVPHWHSSGHRITYWNKFARPGTLPLYYNPVTYLAGAWWEDSARAAELGRAKKANRAFRAR